MVAASLHDLTKIPIGDLHKAAINLGLAQPSDQLRRDDLMLLLSGKGITLSQLRAAMTAHPAPTPATPLPAIDATRQTQLEAAVAAQANTIASFNNSLQNINSSVIRIADTVSRRNAENDAKFQAMDAVLANLPKPQELPDFKALISQAVAEAFKPIKEAMNELPEERQQEIAASITVTRERKAIKDVFGVALEGTCEIWGPPGDYDPDYQFDPQALQFALLALETGNNLWLFGEKGTGKTEFTRNLAARLGRQWFRVNFDRHSERAEFIGSMGLKEGETAWKDGAILQAFRTPGAICLCDEFTMSRGGNISVMNSLTEPSGFYRVADTGEQVKRAPGMTFIVADNTNGNGNTGRYTDASEQNASLLDRFAWFYELKFLPPEIEIAVIMKKTGCKKALAEALVHLFARCRAEVGGAVIEPPSLRMGFAFCQAVMAGIDARLAWETSVVHKGPIEGHEGLRQLFMAHFNARWDRK